MQLWPGNDSHPHCRLKSPWFLSKASDATCTGQKHGPRSLTLQQPLARLIHRGGSLHVHMTLRDFLASQRDSTKPPASTSRSPRSPGGQESPPQPGNAHPEMPGRTCAHLVFTNKSAHRPTGGQQHVHRVLRTTAKVDKAGTDLHKS